MREGWGQVTIAAPDYYERCRPLVEETIRTVSELVGDQPVEALYVTGGGSELPLISRTLREEFGRRVRRSAYTRSATAIGLAIQADTVSGYALRDVFSRNFGVWREADGGRLMVFDVIFPRGTPLPASGEPPLEARREYLPAHNIGYFRYLEASRVDERAQPAGDITLWDEVLFPMDPALETREPLDGTAVEPSAVAARQQIEERYECDGAGGLAVTIANLTSKHARRYPLGRWCARNAVLPAPTRRRTRR